MLNYIFRRLILIVPTLVGIMCLNFFLVQFVPGGPIEQIISDLEKNSSFLDRIGGGSQEVRTSDGLESYKGSVGLPKDFIDELEAQFGFDKPPIERFYHMIINYMKFDFGESYYRDIKVIDLVIEKLPVSISLGLWMTLISYLISIPLGIETFFKLFSSFFNFLFFFLVFSSSSMISFSNCKYGPNLPFLRKISLPLSFFPTNLGSASVNCCAALDFDSGLVNLHSG